MPRNDRRPTIDVPTTAVIYTRVSTDAQARDGLSLAAQLARCRAVAAARDLVVISEHCDDGVSGRADLAQRPALRAALDVCKRERAVLVAYSVSRVARRQRLLWTLLDPDGDHRLAFVSCTESFDTTTPMGRAMLGMLAVWGALETDLVSERTRDALAHAKSQGRRLGAPSTLSRRPELAARIVALHARGLSLRAICDELNRDKTPTLRGGRWWPKTVQHVLAEAAR